MNSKRSLWIVAISCILLACLSRIMPHWHNFTAVGATSLFAGFYFRKRLALLIPILSIFISDLIINNVQYGHYFDSFAWLPSFTLASIIIYLIITLLAKVIHRSNRIIGVISSSLVISMIFFIGSNFMVWLGSTTYPQNIGGLLLCFEAGVPFFLNTLIGNLFYCFLVFKGYELAVGRQWISVLPSNT